MREAIRVGSLIASEVVWAEVGAAFPSSNVAAVSLGRLGIAFSPLTADAAGAAGEAWRRYRQTGGPKHRLIADFLVGAHAGSMADRLLTRDRGFYRRYFESVAVLDPSA